MSDMTWADVRDFKSGIEWHSPLIANTGMRDAPTTTASDSALDAEYERTFGALDMAKAYGERVGLKLGLEGGTMDARDRDALWASVQLARERINWIGRYLNRLLTERALREARREHEARVASARTRLAQLEDAAAARGEAVAP